MAELDVPSPRERHALVGHRAAAASLLEAERAGRLHHAWLIGGPQGIGKATLAYRFARHLLAPRNERIAGGDGLAVDPHGRTARQVAARSHPNLVTVERAAPESGKPVPRVIAVDVVRKALALFGSTAADGGRRICIVDAADDLNGNAANALLKVVEEPPPGALILLVSHAPQRVLPTIRSRCRRLSLSRLSDEEVAAVLADLGGPAAEPTIRRAAALAGGSVGRALAFADPRRIALADELTGLLDGLPDAPTGRVLALADKVADKRAADDLPIVLDLLIGWMSERVRRAPGRPLARLAPLAELCEKVAEAARSVEVYNLDRRAFIVSTVGDLADAVRRAA